MIALDASVLIAYLSRIDASHAAAKRILADGHRRMAHTMTIAEVLAGPAAAGRLTQARRQLTNISLEEVDRVAEESSALAMLRAETRLKLPECCVVLAAESCGSRVATFDRRLADAARARGIKVLDGAS